MFTSDTLLAIYRQATTGIFAVLVGVVALSLVVGGIVIMNIMLMVVSERTREIGLRKALGARRRDIVWQILTESVTLSTMGGVVGTLLGFVPALIVARLTPLPAAVEVWSVAIGIGITAFVGLFFGLYPAMRAARLDPIEALRREYSHGRYPLGLFGEIVAMSIDTLRASKMRSALTVLGVVIGITSIVGMTSLIRGFDESLRDSIRELGPNTIFVAKFSGLSIMSGKDFVELLKRPNLTMADARAIARESPSVALLDVMLGGGPNSRERVFYRNQRTQEVSHLRYDPDVRPGQIPKIRMGRFFTEGEVQHRR